MISSIHIFSFLLGYIEENLVGEGQLKKLVDYFRYNYNDGLLLTL